MAWPRKYSAARRSAAARGAAERPIEERAGRVGKSAICMWTCAWAISQPGIARLALQRVVERAQRRGAVAAAGQRRASVLDSTTGQPCGQNLAHLGDVLLAVGLAAEPAELEGADAEIERAVEGGELRGRQDLVSSSTRGVAGRSDGRPAGPPSPNAARAARPSPHRRRCVLRHGVGRKPSAGLQMPRISLKQLRVASGAIWHMHQPLCIRRLPDAGPCPYFATRSARSDFQEYPTNGRRPSQQLQGPQDAEGRRQELHLLQPEGGREGGRRPLPPALLAARPDGKPGPPRGRHHGQEGRHRRLRRLGEERRQVGQGDQLPPRPRADAGFHRRARGGRSRRDARRHGQAGRRRQEDQSAGAGRPRDRPFGDRRQFRQQRAPSAPTSKLEYERNLERYQFLRWGAMAFDNFRVVPPGTGICHQVNLEFLSQVVCQQKERQGDDRSIPTRWSAPTATPRW